MNIISVSKSVIFILLSFCVTSVQGEARSQFVGFSNEKFNGAGGIFNMQRACNAFSSKSHVCNTTEVAHSTYDEDADYNLTSTEAWILVDIQYSDDNSAISEFGLVGVGLDRAKRTFNCHGWRVKDFGETNEGATVTTQGWFKNTTQCNTILPVACCK